MTAEVPDDLAGEVAALEASGHPRKAAIAAVAIRYKLRKRDVYAAVVDAKP